MRHYSHFFILITIVYIHNASIYGANVSNEEKREIEKIITHHNTHQTQREYHNLSSEIAEEMLDLISQSSHPSSLVISLLQHVEDIHNHPGLFVFEIEKAIQNFKKDPNPLLPHSLEILANTPIEYKANIADKLLTHRYPSDLINLEKEVASYLHPAACIHYARERLHRLISERNENEARNFYAWVDPLITNLIENASSEDHKEHNWSLYRRLEKYFEENISLNDKHLEQSPTIKPSRCRGIFIALKNITPLTGAIPSKSQSL